MREGFSMEKTAQARRGLNLGGKQAGKRIAGKKRKRLSGPAAAALGSGTALGGYVALLALLAALLARGTVPEGSLTGAVMVCCALSALAGGAVSAGRSTWRPMPAGFSVGAVMAVILVLGGLSAPKPPDWAGQGGALVLCALGGGLLAGFLAARRARRKRHH